MCPPCFLQTNSGFHPRGCAILCNTRTVLNSDLTFHSEGNKPTAVAAPLCNTYRNQLLTRNLSRDNISDDLVCSKLSVWGGRRTYDNSWHDCITYQQVRTNGRQCFLHWFCNAVTLKSSVNTTMKITRPKLYSLLTTTPAHFAPMQIKKRSRCGGTGTYSQAGRKSDKLCAARNAELVVRIDILLQRG